MQKASPLGLKKSFGFGDRLGIATPGHLDANRKYDFAPIFAQQSIREMTRTNRTAVEVMHAAQAALEYEKYDGVWGADADHLKTPEDVQVTAAAGFTFFTIDPSSYVNNEADTMDAAKLQALAAQLEREEIFRRSEYLGKKFDLGETSLEFTEESLLRAAVKYGRAIAHSANMAAEIKSRDPQAEIEISVDETEHATTPLEHFFFGAELKRRGVQVVSLAPRFVGDFEKGIDYRGDLNEFEKQLKVHVSIAKHCGPYKISIHSGSDKFSAYPIIGRVCGDLLHVKTAGTSYLEALRAVLRSDKELFREIVEFSHSRFTKDRASYHISTTDDEVIDLERSPIHEAERLYLNERAGRQLLHVTFGSVLTIGRRPDGTLFHSAIMETLETNADLHRELVAVHFEKHLSLLNAG
ncbi:MAG: tagaturonate epimerase family protein [Chthoniobacterales bacterium]